MRSILLACAVWACWTASAANAAVINFGIDIKNDRGRETTSAGQQVGYFNGDNSGDTLLGACVDGAGPGCGPGSKWLSNDTVEFEILTDAAFWTDKVINSIDFFVDAEGIDAHERFDVYLGTDLDWTRIGRALDTTDAATRIPRRVGGRRLSPDAGDEDNSFWLFDTDAALFSDEIASGLLKFKIARFRPNDQDFASEARFDGVNLQVDYSTVPEPASILMVGAGLAGLAARARRRR